LLGTKKGVGVAGVSGSSHYYILHLKTGMFKGRETFDRGNRKMQRKREPSFAIKSRGFQETSLQGERPFRKKKNSRVLVGWGTS